MGDKVISERPVGEYVIDGRRVKITRLSWRDAEGLSYDITDAETGELLRDESFDDYPTEGEVREALTAGDGQPLKAAPHTPNDT